MDQLKLNNIGVTELSSSETKNINGGFALFAAFMIGFFVGALFGGLAAATDETADIKPE